MELAVAGFAPIAVSERARRPAVIAVRKSSVSGGVHRASSLERVSDLPQDLGLPEHERVETGRDAAEVAGRVLARMDVEVLNEQVARNIVNRRERVHEFVAGVVDT